MPEKTDIEYSADIRHLFLVLLNIFRALILLQWPLDC